MKMLNKNSVAYRVAVLTCSNLALQVMGFVYRIALTAYAGTEALGLNSLVMQVYSVVISVCMSGLCVAVTAIAASIKAAGGNADMRSAGIRALMKKAAVIYILLWTLMALPVFVLRYSVAEALLNNSKAGATLALMLFCILMTGAENLLKAVHIGTERVRQCAVSELSEQAIRFFLVILLLKNIAHIDSAETVFLIMLGMVFSEFFSVSFLFISYIRCFIGKRQISLSIKNAARSSVAYSRILKVTLPAAFTAVASTIFASIGSLLLPSRLALAGYTEAQALSTIGVLSTVAVPLTLFPMAAVGAMASVIMPAISERHATGDVNGKKRLIEKAMNITGFVGFVATAVITPSAPVVSRLLFGVMAELPIFILLGVKAIVIYYQVMSVAALNGLLKQRTVLVFAVAGEAFQLLLITLLSSIPKLGVFGYIIAMIAGELCRLVCNLAMIEYYTGFSPVRAAQLIRVAVIGGASYAAASLSVKSLIASGNSEAFIIITSIFVATAVAAVLTLLSRRAFRYGKRSGNVVI